MTATASPPRVRTRLLRAAQAAVATLMAAAVLLPTPAAADAEEEHLARAATLVLAPHHGGLVAEGGTAQMGIALRNATDDALSAGRVALEVGDHPLGTASELDAWLRFDRYADSFSVAASRATEEVPARETAEFDLFIAVPNEPGVYPVRATITGAEVAENAVLSPVAHSVLVVGGGSRSITLLVPLTLTPADGTLLSAAELAEATAADGVLTATLDALGGTAAVLAVDPAIPAAIRVLGDAAPESAAAWLERLESLPNERFALQFADADATAQAQAGLSAPLAPPALTSSVDPENFAAETTLPDLETLSDIRGALPNMLWPRGALRDDDLAAFAAYYGAETTTLLPDSTDSGYASVGEHRAILFHPELSDAWALAVSESDAGIRAPLLAAAVARLSLTEGESVVLALPRDEDRSGEGLAEAVAALTRLGSSTSLAQLRARTPTPVALDAGTDEERAEAVAMLLDDERELDAFAVILDDPTVLTDRSRLRLLRVLRVGDHPEGFAAARDAERERTRQILDSVSLLPSSDVQILSASVDLPVGVRNELPWAVTVTLNALPGDPRLDVQRSTTVTLLPQSTDRVRVPVEARVGSGEVNVYLTLTTAAGTPVGDSTVTHVKVRADWEAIGLRILAALVVALFVVGLIRTIRRRRRGAAGAPAERSAAE